MINELIKVDVSFLLKELRLVVKGAVLEVLAEHEAKLSPKEDELLSIEQTATKMGVTKSTLWRWEKTGYLKPIRLGAKPKYRISDIHKIMQEGRRWIE